MNQARINTNAFYADETPQFRSPAEPKENDTVTFRFRVKKEEALSVRLTGNLLSKGEEESSSPDFSLALAKEKSDEGFDYYAGQMNVGTEPLQYVFEIAADGERYVYDRLGVHREKEKREEGAFLVYPGFATPDWAKGRVFYQIFIDRFYNGNPDADVLTNEYVYVGHPAEHADWNSETGNFDVFRFYGGDLVGLEKKLDYLSYLGIEGIYLNPVFLSPSNHKYDVQDYRYIDPHLVGFPEDSGELLPPGEYDNRKAARYRTRVQSPANLENANRFFCRLVEKIHDRGMKIILDGVFNHSGSFHPWFDREGIYENNAAPGAYRTPDSATRDYYLFPENAVWPEPSYRAWYDMETLPKLNYENPNGVWQEILQIGAKWVSAPYDCDGWRLDVAADIGTTEEINHRFLQDFRKAVKKANPDALILAEHYGNPRKWLNGHEWDTVMNYDGFMDPVSWFLTGTEKHCNFRDERLHGNGRAFFENYFRASARLPYGAHYTAMNQLSNHDHARFLTRTKSETGTLSERGYASAGQKLSYATFREGTVMLFTLPGAPTVYYGDETGMVGWTDPDNRRPFPWGKENWDVIAFYKDLIKIHKKYSALRTGSMKALEDDYGYVAYGRFDENAAVVVLINHSDHDRTVHVPVWEVGITGSANVTRILETGEIGYNVGTTDRKVEDGCLITVVPAWSATIFVKEKNEKYLR